MSDEDELTSDFDEGEPSDVSDSSDNDTEAEIAQRELVSENDQISAEEDSMNSDDALAADSDITQAEVYENLKRIGELEDEKRKIQEELRERTEQLRAVIRHIDRGSILYKMLQSALADSAPKAAAGVGEKKASKGAPKATPKKASKKKARR